MVEQGVGKGLVSVRLLRGFGVYNTAIIRVTARFRQYGKPVMRHGLGKTRAISAASHSFLVTQEQGNRFATAKQLRSDLQNAVGSVCLQKLYVHIRMKVVSDREDHVNRSGSLYTTVGSDMTGPCWLEQDELAAVLYTDKSRYCLHYSYRRASVWRRQNHDRLGGGSIMV